MDTAHRMEDLGQYRTKLLWYARTKLFNPAHAEDAVQETLLAAVQGFDRFAGGSSLYSWLTGILKHKIVDCVRCAAREQWHGIDNDGTPLAAAEAEFAPDGGTPVARKGWSEPEQALNRRQMIEALDGCVRQLPERTAQAFMLRQVMGLDTREACRMLDLSESNCSVMLHRARNRVRKSMDPDWLEQ